MADSFLAKSMGDTRAQSEMYARAVGGAEMGGGANPLGLGTSGSNFGLGTRRNDMTVHAEQYRHNSGWVAASIAPIAKRIARQPVHMAKTAGATPEKGALAMVNHKRFSASGRVKMKPWETGDAKQTAATLWFKRSLPGAFKSVAATAELIDNHPLLDAIDNPNPIMVRWSLMFVTVASLLLTGKAYWWVVAAEEGDADENGVKGKTLQIWPLPSNWVTPIHTEVALYDHWEVRPDGTTEPIPVKKEQIIYFYFPDPAALLGSQSPLQNQSRAVISDEAIAEAQRRSFANGAFPGVAVVVGRQTDVNGQPGERPTLNREQRAQIMTAFKQAYRGVYNADEPIILDQLIQDIKRITNTPREMDFTQSGGYTKERITQGFGVNPIVMGQVEGANRASSATADDHLCQSTVNPIIEMISQTVTAWMNPLMSAPGERYYWFIEEARAVDPDSDRADWQALYMAGGCNRDELRAGLRNLPPMEDGSSAYIPSGLVKISARLAADVPSAPAAPAAQLPVAQPAPADAPKPSDPKPPAPTGGDAPSSGGGAPPAAPAEPAKNSESKTRGERLVEFVDSLAKMGARGFRVDSAKEVLCALYRWADADALDTVLRVCGDGDRVKRLTPADVGFVVRIMKAAEGGTPHPLTQEFEIPVREVFQEKPFDCGAAVAYAAAEAMGITPGSYTDFMVALDTEEQVGTQPSDLFAYFAHHGCDPKKANNRTVDHLRAELLNGRLCICPVQYFGDGPVPGGEGGEAEDGHYVLVYGFTADSLKVLDPLDGFMIVGNNDFVGNWYDRDQDGRPFTRFCLSVGPKPKPLVDPIS